MEEKNFVLEFLELYRSLPALWNVKGKEYSNRNIKNVQYETLLKKYQEKYPEANKKEMMQKINSLRTNYRREPRRISALERSGSGLCDENEPTLFYFEAMDFLHDNETACPSRSSMAIEETEEIETPKKRKNVDSNDEFIALATKRLLQPKDEFHGVAQTWAFKLKKLDDTQRIFADKFINDILFEAELGNLHRNAMHLNVASQPSIPQSTRGSFTNSSVVEMPAVSPYSSASNLSYSDATFGRSSSTIQIPMISPPNFGSNDGSGRNIIIQPPMASTQTISNNEPGQTFIIRAPMVSPQNILSNGPGRNSLSRPPMVSSWETSSAHSQRISPENSSHQIASEDCHTDISKYFQAYQ